MILYCSGANGIFMKLKVVVSSVLANGELTVMECYAGRDANLFCSEGLYLYWWSKSKQFIFKKYTLMWLLTLITNLHTTKVIQNRGGGLVTSVNPGLEILLLFTFLFFR